MVGVRNGSGLFHMGYVPRGVAHIVAAIGGRLPALRVLSGATAYGARVALTV